MESKNRKPKNSFSKYSASTAQVKANTTHIIKIIQSIVFSPFLLCLYFTMNEEENQVEFSDVIRTKKQLLKLWEKILPKFFLIFNSDNN